MIRSFTPRSLSLLLPQHQAQSARLKPFWWLKQIALEKGLSLLSPQQRIRVHGWSPFDGWSNCPWKVWAFNHLSTKAECAAKPPLMAEIIAKFQGKASDLKSHISLRFGSTEDWYGIQLGTLGTLVQRWPTGPKTTSDSHCPWGPPSDLTMRLGPLA
jgi:hypothetical protein